MNTENTRSQVNNTEWYGIQILNDRVSDLQKNMESLKTDLKDDMASLKTELKDDMASLKTELKGDMASLKTDLKDDMASLKTDILGSIRIYILITGLILTIMSNWVEIKTFFNI